MIKKSLNQFKLLVSSGKNKIKESYNKNKKKLYRFIGKAFITIIKIIVEKLLDKWL